jgi:hypothetical protein
LLATHTALELREWMAYEAKSGPLGQQWDRRMTADLHYLMQWNNYLLGAQLTPEGKKNKVPEPAFPGGEGDDQLLWMRYEEPEDEDEDDYEEE